jgi:hypothetical protein
LQISNLGGGGGLDKQAECEKYYVFAWQSEVNGILQQNNILSLKLKGTENNKLNIAHLILPCSLRESILEESMHL